MRKRSLADKRSPRGGRFLTSFRQDLKTKAYALHFETNF